MLKVQYDLNCIKIAIEPQPANQPRRFEIVVTAVTVSSVTLALVTIEFLQFLH